MLTKVSIQPSVRTMSILDVVSSFGEDDEYPGCRIVLFPEYIFQVFFKVLETNPVIRKVTEEIKTIPLTQGTNKDDSDDLVAKILRDINTL